MSNARTKLKEASAAVTQLESEINQLEISFARSKEITAEAETSLTDFEGLDSTIGKYRAEAVKAGRDPRQLPAKLKEKMRLRTEAAEELKQAEETCEVLESELREAKKRLSILNRDRANLAASVIREHVAEYGRELLALNRRRWEIKQLLSGCYHANCYLNGIGQFQIGLLPGTADTLKDYSIGGYPAGIDPVEVTAQRWTAQFKALLANPDAPVGDLKPVLPEDYGRKNTGTDQPPILVFVPS